MSIEIKELVVKFNVTEKREQVKNNNGNDLSSVNYKKLVKDCTDKVLRELEYRIER
jgi:ferredoxin-like protein FixX